MKQVIITVDELTGAANVEAKGFTGGACHAHTQPYALALNSTGGKVELKPEAGGQTQAMGASSSAARQLRTSR